MTEKLARACAVGILAFSVAAVVATGTTAVRVQDRIEPGTVVLVGDPNAPDMQRVQDQLEGRAEAGDPLTASLQLNAGFVVLAVLVLLWVAVGALIIWRQPTNWAGWLFLIIGAAVPVQSVASAAVITDLRAGGSLPLTGLAAWIGEFALYPVTLFVLLLLLYPDGHPPSRRWRLAVAGLLGGTALAFLGFLLRPGPFNNFRGDGIVYENPLGIDAFTWAGTLIAAGTAIALAAGLSTVVAVIQRFRRSTGEERQQMRLLAFVAGVAGFWLVLAILVTFLGGALGLESEGSVPIFPILLGLAALTLILGIPAAYLVAIFRYRLWDIEVVIRKTLVALVLTLIIGGVALLVLALSTQVAWTLPDPLPFFWLMAVGAMALPFLRLARRIAKRVVFGKRATQQEVLAAFGERVGEGYAVVDVLPRMVRVLANATGATSARVLLRIGDELREEAAVGEPAGEEHIVPVIYEGKELGALATTFPPNDPIDASKTQLMENLAGQASLALRNVKLIEELRASRQRLVAAQDEERRKLERNIHDGAQQQLVALAVKLRLAQGLVAKDPAKAEAMLGDLQSEAQTTLEDLRDLARGIYPPLLADKGLVAALEAQAKRAPIPVTVESDSTGRYPEAVESAVYFCALEALNNVAKYAEASRVTLSLTQTDGHLTFSVADDGRGFDPAETGYGTGLQGMADRLDAVGGSLEVRSVPTHGTTVVGLVPVRPGTAP